MSFMNCLRHPVLVAVAFLFASGPVHAAGVQAFDAAAFQAAQESGKPILVEVHADWLVGITTRF